MGVRAQIFRRPTCEIIDFTWYELTREIQNLKKISTYTIGPAINCLESAVGMILPFVDPRLIDGQRHLAIPDENCGHLDETSSLCDSWNTVRANVLWVCSKVEFGHIDKLVLSYLLQANEILSKLVRQINPLNEEGGQRFSTSSTTPVDPVEALRHVRAGYMTQYAFQKHLSVGSLPLAIATKQWALPMQGWTRDLAEEVGRVIGDIQATKHEGNLPILRGKKGLIETTEILKNAKHHSNPERSLYTSVVGLIY